MPCLIEAETLKVLPDACGSPASSALSEMPRLISFSLKTSSAAFTRSSLSAWRLTACSPAQLIDALVPRKSNRWDSSLAVWLSALSTSCRSTLLTTSKEESAMGPTVLTRARPRSPVRPPARPLYPAPPTPARPAHGRLPEWSKGAVCKTAGSAYVGSNPTPATRSTFAPRRGRGRRTLRLGSCGPVDGSSPAGDRRARRGRHPRRRRPARRSSCCGLADAGRLGGLGYRCCG